MLKKVLIIIISSFILCSCSSMPTTKNSTVVLYVSHKIEGPLYIPKSDSSKGYAKSDYSKGYDKTSYKTNSYNGYKTRTGGRGEILILEEPIRFAFEKFNITSDYDDSIDYVANYMKEYPNIRMVVEGHTDRVGPEAFNKALSLRRARAAITKLTRAGIKKDRLIESGVGLKFSEYNLNRLNRRVEFIIIRSDKDLTDYKEKVE